MQVENKEFIEQDSIKNLDHAGDAPADKEEKATPAPKKDEVVVETKAEEEKTEKKDDADKKAETEEEEEDPEKLRERTRKAEEEKEKMLQALRKTKSEYRKLASEKKKDADQEEDEEEIDSSEWDDDSKKFRKETIELATRKAEAVIERSNERQAVDIVVEKYPDVLEYWQDLMANYHQRPGESTVSARVKDLENARLITLNDRGELEKQFASAEQRGVAKGIKKAVVAEMALSGRSGKGTGSSKGVSSTASEMAKHMNLDPKKVEKENDSSEAVIKF